MRANNAASKVSCELKLTLPQEDPPALQEGTHKKLALQAFMAEPHRDITSLQGHCGCDSGSSWPGSQGHHSLLHIPRFLLHWSGHHRRAARYQAKCKNACSAAAAYIVPWAKIATVSALVDSNTINQQQLELAWPDDTAAFHSNLRATATSSCSMMPEANAK